MFQNVQTELSRVRSEVGAAIRKGNPTLEIRMTMIMATAWLGVLAERFIRTNNFRERRRLFDEFNKKRITIERAIRGYTRGSAKGDVHRKHELRRVLP